MFGAFNIGSTGMRAAQMGIDVTSHNVANVHTDGYRRQVVELSEASRSVGSGSEFGGLGVNISNIRTADDQFLLGLVNDYATNNAGDALAADALGKLNDILNKYNLVDSSQKLLNGFQDVANNPTSVPIREDLFSKLQNFSSTAQELNYSLGEFSKYVNDTNTTNLEGTNNLLKQIADINNTLGQTPSNTSSTLTSQKNALIKQLAEKVKITVSNDGQTITGENGKVLVQGNTFTAISASDVSSFKYGIFGGMNSVSGILGTLQSQLPGAISTFTSEINNQHKKGFDLNGVAGKDIFGNVSSGLANLTVNITNAQEIAASSVTTPGVNDGTNSQAISDIRYKIFNNETIYDQLNELNRKVASLKSNYDNSSSISGGLYDDAVNKYNLSNVNLDEEGVNLLKYQKMYEANAKIIQVANDMLGTLLNIKA